MLKSRIWGTAGSRRRSLQAIALTIIAAVSIALPTLGGSGASTVLAQSGPPPMRAHVGHKVALAGSLPLAVRSAKRTGLANAQQSLQITISLGFSDPVGLATLLAAQRDHSSPQYHKYITPQEFNARFAPTAQSVAAVRQFLTSQGLSVTGVSSNRTIIHAAGSVAQAERAFGVTIATYLLDKRNVYAPTAAPQIPDSLANIVLNVGGLDNILKAKPELVPTASNTPASARRAAAAADTNPVPGAFAPADLRGAYDVSSLISAGGTGSGQHIAVFELAPYIPSDVTAYRSQYLLPNPTINNISVDSASNTCVTPGSACDNGSGIVEADLDMQVVSAIAANATQDVYTGPNTYQGLLDTYNAIVAANADPVTTTSWGFCEPYAGSYALHALDQIFAQGAVQGQSFLAAAGDTGSDDCFRSYGGFVSNPAVDSPASDPYVLGVGGTSLTLSGGGYGSETVWNRGYAGNLGGGAGGGGISSNFDQPSWQVGGGVVNSYSTGEREVPDITADADPYTGYSEYCSSTVECIGPSSPWIEIGGTSAAAPLWAAILTNINSYLSANAVTPLGWSNATLYQLFSNAQTYTPYHDITVGNNNDDYSSGPYVGDYPATACYDQASGIGSPDAWNIARDVQGGVKLAGGGPCPNTAPATTNLVQDGGFELPSGSSPWSQYSRLGYNEILSSAQAHTGAASYNPCGYPNCDDRAWQTITIPTGTSIHKATLRFWLETGSLDPVLFASTLCTDHFYVTLSTSDGTVVPGGSIMASCPTSPIFNYAYETFDVTSLLKSYGGQKLTLTFRATSANEAPIPGFYSYWNVDDVALNVS